MKRTATAAWVGPLKEGRGTLTTQSGVLRGTPYGYKSRFTEGAVGTNPEELVAAAHAGCFTMALSAILGEAGFTADQIETRSTLTMEKTEAGPTVIEAHLDVAATMAGIELPAFQEAAQKAKETCAMSRLLKTNITLSTSLQSRSIDIAPGGPSDACTSAAV